MPPDSRFPFLVMAAIPMEGVTVRVAPADS